MMMVLIILTEVISTPPPSWIQGVWLQQNLTINNRLELRIDDLCTMSSNISTCFKSLIEIGDSNPNPQSTVYEEITDSRYYIETAVGFTEYKYNFITVSNTSINWILSPTVQAILVKKCKSI